MKELPTSRTEALRRLPKSVASRLGSNKCSSLDEARVVVRLAETVCGPWAGIMCAFECYCIPVQYAGSYEVSDLLWYISIKGNGVLADFRRYLRVLSSLAEEKRFGLVRPYECDRGYSHRTNHKFRDYSRWAWWGSSSALEVFPVKKDVPEQKINLWFEDVWVDMVTFFPEVAMYLGRFRAALYGCRNDEATAWSMWVCSSFRAMGLDAIALCATIRRNAEALKDLNVLVKALGLQSSELGPLLCELNTLSGRGVRVPSPIEDIGPRVRMSTFRKEKLAYVDPGKLRSAIRAVIRDEIVTPPVWGEVEDYWTRRWLYTRAGSHSRYPEELWFGERLPLPPQPTRREFSEVCDVNIVALGKPRVDAGLSWKLEHGKTRAIYGCDTRSYYTFDYLLRPVEAVWRNSRVLLDPGREPQALLYPRLARRAGLRYMLDFDDFNSQHSIEAMQMCIEEACSGAPPEILHWAVQSWSNMHVHWGSGEKIESKRMVGTLPSGHRATSFINTILNAAYCRVVMDDLYDKVSSFHAGDDVVINGNSDVLSVIVPRFLKSQFRINKSKQSVGEACGEFLRISYTKLYARGYVARGISSLVSGNWVTENRLDKRSYVETLVRGTWTMCARARRPGLGLLCKTSLERWVPELKGFTAELLNHSLSLDGTPVRSRVHRRKVSVLRLTGGRAKYSAPGLAAYHATDDFMHNHVDFKLLEAAGVEPSMLRGAMLKASKKPRNIESVGDVGVAVDHCLGHLPLGAMQAFRSRAREDKGREEAMALLRRMFSEIDWRSLVASLRGGDQSLMSVDGKCEWPVLTEYELPFSDCMSVRRKTTWPTSLLVGYPVYA